MEFSLALLLQYVGVLFVGFVIIAKAGDIFVDSSCVIAKKLKVSRAVIGLIVVAFATSLPEFVLSTMAAGLGRVGIAYGNIVGSCIGNIGLVLGVAVIGVAIPIGKERLHDGVIMLAVGCILTLMGLDGELSRYDGIGLMVAFALFLGFILRREIKRKSSPSKGAKIPRKLKYPTLLFIVGALGVVIASRMLIYSGVGIADEILGISPTVIGLTVIAIGTSLPELATAVVSAVKKVPELSLGMILGSNIFNIALVLGTSSMIAPLAVDSQSIEFSNPVMLGTMALLLAFMARRRLTWKLGILMLGLYLFYVVALFAFWYA